MKSVAKETSVSTAPGRPLAAVRRFLDRIDGHGRALLSELAALSGEGRDGWTLRIVAGSRSIDAVREASGISTTIATVASPLDADGAARIREAVTRLPEPPASTAIDIDPALASQRTVQLPTRDAAYIAAILRNRVERLGPWRASKAMFGYQVEAWSEASRQAQVRVAVVSRTAVEDLTDLLAQQGLQIDRIDVGAQGSAVPILTRPSARHRRVARRIGVAYAGALAVLMAGLTAVEGYDLYLAGRIEPLRARLGADAALEGAGAPVTGRALIARKRQEHMRVGVVSEISRLLPDNAWLSALKIDGNGVEMTGKSRDVPSIIGALQASRMLDDVRFSAPTVHADGDESGEFSISATIRGKGTAP